MLQNKPEMRETVRGGKKKQTVKNELVARSFKDLLQRRKSWVVMYSWKKLEEAEEACSQGAIHAFLII